MDNRVVRVPVSVLLDPTLSASEKVIWMAMSLQPAATPAELQTRTGLSRPTVQRGLSRANSYRPAAGGPRAVVPVRLLAERGVGAQAKMLYGLLQTTPNFRGDGGQFTYLALSALTPLSYSTAKRAFAELVGAGWVLAARANRLGPISFTLGSPELRCSRDEVAAARRRLKRAKFAGEALMNEYLSLLIDSDQFTDNARPGFLVSPLTGERLELDRFYPPSVAFEFHGAQHDRATGRSSQAEVDAQQLRDLIKAGICLYRGIHLVIIRPEELSLEEIRRKIGRCMPLRELAGHEGLIELLEEASLAYQASTPPAPQVAGPAGSRPPNKFRSNL